jgi:murein DD-endopeptidase MepM/ murein hydrolase activator NlpD
MRRLVGAICALFLMLVATPAAFAVPDGDLRTYLERDAPLWLEWPARGTVTDGWGPRWGRMHRGIDVGILERLEVTAAAPGTVTTAGWLRGYEGYGHVVLVDVGDGHSVLYAHLAASSVRPGQWLERGERLGTAGCTGWCTGTHLHFELRQAGVAVDPAPYLR